MVSESPQVHSLHPVAQLQVGDRQSPDRHAAGGTPRPLLLLHAGLHRQKDDGRLTGPHYPQEATPISAVY